MRGAVSMMNTVELPPEELITPAEAARRVSLSRNTILNWIYAGKLGKDQGLYYVAGRPRIDWALFAKAFVRQAS